MFPPAIVAIFLGAIPNVYAVANQQNKSLQREQLVSQLNQEFKCRLMIFNDGEQMLYARETSLPECNPLVAGDFKRAGDLLNALAVTSPPVDAQVLRDKAKAYNEFGPNVREIGELREALIQKNVLKIDGADVRVDHIGHPYQADDRSRWLQAYVQSVRRLVEQVSERQGYGASAVEACPQPACDPKMYEVAEAIALRPPIDWAFLRPTERPTAPSTYALSYFSQRYAGNSRICRILGLNCEQAWLWNPSHYTSRINGEGALVFEDIFLKDQIVVSLGNWTEQSEYPNVVPLLYLFQEARGVIDVLQTLQDNQVVREIREIRFEPAEAKGSLLQLSKLPGGSRRLHIRALKVPGDLPVESTRALIHHQLPAFLRTATQMAEQQL
ncbi:MAG: hypothetical protein KF799_12785 [Bdellovibrionales bacterium]|nr:hypothetical protein [Bdellovibrionales bacterium]